MEENKRYYQLESVNCWVDTETLSICSSIKETGEPDLDNVKPISDVDPTWYIQLSNSDKEYISNLINTKKE